jgi:uncharacterized linocin/CFP29 family protein
MTDKFLHRDDAPFGDAVWALVDATVTGAAKSQLSARRLVHIDGPYGLGLKAVPGGDAATEKASTQDGVTVSAGAGRPLALIRMGFSLPVRDIAAFEATGLPLPLGVAARAAIACAKQEDDLLFNGSKALGVEGLLTAKGGQTMELKPWNEVGAAADDLIAAATALDRAGCHGPYSLALAPARYNLLLRRYPQGNTTEMQHAQQIATDGIVKAPSIASGGVLIASGRQYATIVIGQDLATGFVGPADGSYDLMVSESLALNLLQPQAVCILK